MSSADNYIFWYASRPEDEDEVGFENEMPIDEGTEGVSDMNEKGKARESMYVALVEEMTKTVLENESFLFSEEELAFFTAYSKLSYQARYLLARLLVRKTGKWYRLGQLKYVSELGEEGIRRAVEELCGSLGDDLNSGSTSPPQSPADPSITQRTNTCVREVIDLISDDEDQCSADASQADPSRSQPRSQTLDGSGCHNGALSYYAQDETWASLPELLKCLTVEELKTISRTLKLPNGLTTRSAYIEALLASSCVQTTLGDFSSSNPSPRSKQTGRDSKSLQLKQTVLSFKPAKETKVQTEVLRTLVMKILKKCIRINDAINALFHRLHIIYFRSTGHPTSLLTPALLRRCRKRFYPLYTYIRTPEVFRTREDLVAYEDALRMEAAVDLMLEGSIDVELAEQHINAWAKGRDSGVSADVPPPHTLRARAESPAHNDHEGKENATGSTPARERSMSTFVKIEMDDELPTPAPKESQAVSNAKYVIGVFEKVYPRWKELVRLRGQTEPRPHGLERFDEGYILTRIIYKGAAAYGRLKEFDREISILEELLAQRRWRRGKRGAWYDRWALILMHHLVREKRESDGKLEALAKDEQQKILREAMSVITRGLEDEDTHIVSRQALEHRLFRLEKRLKVPLEKRHECLGKLRKAKEVSVTGERMRQRKAAVGQDKTSKIINKAAVPVSVQIQGEEAVRRHLDQVKKEQRKTKERWMGKSLWYGKCGEEVNVETLVLQHYELKGFKGFHSEASIVSSVWGLLFWDILFSPVPGVFETPYQSAPLDIASEYFFFARRELIYQRLKEIEKGRAPEILAEIDDKYRKNNTMCVGVRWDDYSKQDLVEIVSCLGGKGLAAICRLFCEDYGGRHSGIPDLIVWRMSDKLAKFVEVKGPGDNLSENQKVWIDVLLRADIEVEVCRVKEPDKAKPDGDVKYPKKHKIIRVYALDEDGNEIRLDEEEEDTLEAEDEPAGPQKKRRKSDPS